MTLPRPDAFLYDGAMHCSLAEAPGSRAGRRPAVGVVGLLVAGLTVFGSPPLGFAGTFVAFGPENYVRGTGEPSTVTNSFTVLNPNTSYTITINNGGLLDSEFEKVSSSVFVLNGTEIVGPNEFNQNVSVIEKPIGLVASNTLSVEVRGKPGGGLTVQLIGVDNDPPTITASVTPAPNAAGWQHANVTVTFTCADATSGVATCPSPITVSAEGANQVISGTAVDRAGNTASTSVTLNIDKTPPAIALTTPAPNLATNRVSLAVAGTVTDANAITSVSVDGTAVTPTTGPFSVNITLSEGSNVLTVAATDIADNTATVTRTVTLDTTPPHVAITAPANLATFNTPTIAVTGTVDDPQATVSVNGAFIPVSNGSFATTLTLGEGTRFITAVASDLLGNTGTASLSVTIDTTPPRVLLTSPANGATVFSSPITVTGMINDIVSGTVNGTNATVTVNGIPAVIANRGFVAEGVPVSAGSNLITAIGTDAAGNQRQATITVTLDTQPTPKLTVLSGNNQTGPIGTPLPQPLVVQATDAAGNPLPNRAVTFRVTRNTGTLTGGQRAVTVNTDSQGKAQVTWTLGSYAGAGENRVEATGPGFPGSVVLIATGVASGAARITQVNDSVFRGAVNTALPQPLQAMVSDSGGNPVQGVPVTFTIVAGGGKVNNTTTVTVASDSDGKAHVIWILGPEDGIANNRVEATFEGNTGLPVTFTASGLVPGDPANTTFSGVILTNTNQPIPGVTITIAGTTLMTQTDAQGQFRLTGVPIGAIHVIADAHTATLPGFPYEMMYDVNTIAGRDNSIGMPIFLLPLDLPHAGQVTATQGTSVAVSNVSGFSLTIPAGSVTFPDGSHSGSISVTQVHRDKVPMPPSNGANPKSVFTIQPAGARFDPPAPIAYPNVDGRAPGEIVNLYSFDHDLGQWVSIGTGSVTDDGAFIQSDPGVGIIHGGWHHAGSTTTPTGIAQSNTSPCTNQFVRNEVNRAWNESNPGPAPDPNRHEQGGWIVRSPDGSLRVDRWLPGTASGMVPPPAPPGVVGSFHTHPNTGPNWEPRPSEADAEWVKAKPNVRAPHYVISENRIYRINPDGSVDDVCAR